MLHPSRQPAPNAIRAQAPPGLGRLDLLFLLITVAMILFASWYRSQDRIFWSDEIMGWLVLRQDTWSHLFKLWYGGIDSSGLFFYVFVRPWLRIFGATELSLHLFSAFGMAIGAVLTWLCARRFYPIQIVAAAVPLLFFMNRTALWQLANGRTYGIVMSAVGLTCYALARTSPEQKDANSRRFVLCIAAASMLLVGSHILGILYWSVFFASLVARDAWFRIFRLPLYLASLAGLPILALSWKNIAATTALGKPSFWTVRPTLQQIPSGLDDFSPKVGAFLLATFVMFVVLLVMRRRQNRIEPVLLPSRPTLYFILAAFALLAVGMFVVSLVGTPIFVNRYMLPMLVGDTLLICELFSRIASMLNLSTRKQTIAMIAALVAIAFLYGVQLRFESVYPQRDYTHALLEKIPQDEPVILTAQGVFIEMTYYRNADRRFETPIDWEVQLDPDFGLGGVSGTHELENLKTFDFHPDQIRSTPEILAGRQRFVVVSDDTHTLWMRKRLLHNPNYRVIDLPPYPGFHIWQVDKAEPTDQ